MEILTNGELPSEDVLKETQYLNVVVIEEGAQQAFISSAWIEKSDKNKKPADVDQPVHYL